jgi:mRNA interferase RelE/StbE
LSPKRYTVIIQTNAQNEIKKFSKDIQEWIARDIEKKLTVSPKEFGKPLSGEFNGCYRLRVSKYRIIYKISENVVTVYVIKADHRQDVYE